MKSFGLPALAALSSLVLPLALSGCQRSTGSSSGASKQIAAKVVDKPAKLEVYVMSKCPFGVQVEKALGPVLDKLGANVELRIGYIGQKQGDELSSMHGPGEVTGDIAQLCAKEVAPDKYFSMISCQDKDPAHVDTNWESCGKDAGIDTAAVKSCMDSKGKGLLSAAFDDARQRGATGSPTMFLNGKPYDGGRKSADFIRAICNTYDGAKPEACANIPVPPRVAAIFFSDKRCAKCNIDPLEGRLKSVFEGLDVKKVDYETPDGKALYAELTKADPSFKYLPAILFDNTVDADAEGKQQLARWLHPLGQYQSLALGGKFDPTGEICDNKLDDNGDGKIDCDDPTCKDTMACRPEKAKQLDLFVMAHCPFGTKAMIAAKEFHDAFGADANIDVHFIGDDQGGQLTSMHGPDEVTDDLREVCATKYYAKDAKYLDFLACRSQDLKADWKACTGSNGIDASVIQKCVDTEAKGLLSASFQLASALDIQASPTFLLNNRQTFNAQTANDIKTQYCAKNAGLAGCTKQLSGAAPTTVAAPSKAGTPSCGTN